MYWPSSVAGFLCSKSRECPKSKNPKSRDYCTLQATPRSEHSTNFSNAANRTISCNVSTRTRRRPGQEDCRHSGAAEGFRQMNQKIRICQGLSPTKQGSLPQVWPLTQLFDLFSSYKSLIWLKIPVPNKWTLIEEDCSLFVPSSNFLIFVPFF